VIVELFPLCLVEIKCVAPREIFKLVREMEAKRRERERIGRFQERFSRWCGTAFNWGWGCEKELDSILIDAERLQRQPPASAG
jgi:hypothetical protein